MDQQARESYIEAQVMTATPQKLRLMLIEAAISFARQTLHHWEAGNNDKALASIVRSRNIISQLLSPISADESELTKQVTSLYLFVFQHLTEAQLRRDSTLVEEVIRVLEVERDTWQTLCDAIPHSPSANADDANCEPRQSTSPPIAYPDTDTLGSSVSFDA